MNQNKEVSLTRYEWLLKARPPAPKYHARHASRSTSQIHYVSGSPVRVGERSKSPSTPGFASTRSRFGSESNFGNVNIPFIGIVPYTQRYSSPEMMKFRRCEGNPDVVTRSLAAGWPEAQNFKKNVNSS